MSRPCLPEFTGAGLTPPPGRVNIQEVMSVPVVATDGHSYELSAISDVFTRGAARVRVRVRVRVS